MSATNYNYYLLRKGEERLLRFKEVKNLVGAKNVPSLLSGKILNIKQGEVYAIAR